MFTHADYADGFYCDLLIHSQTRVVHIGDRCYGEYDHPSLKWIRPISEDVSQIIKGTKQIDQLFFSPFEEQHKENCRFGYRIAVDEVLSDDETSTLVDALLLYFRSLQVQTSIDWACFSSNSEKNRAQNNSISENIDNLVVALVKDRLKKIGGSEITYPYTVDIRDSHSITMTGVYPPKPTISRTPPKPCEVLARIMGIGRPHGGIANVAMDILIPNSKKLDKINAAYVLKDYSRSLNSILHNMEFHRITLTYQDDLNGHFVASVTDVCLEPISEIDVNTAMRSCSQQFKL
ncbi:MAG: hypothetical protein K1562_19705 [Candidatus Thiodiazotropha sp. (ex. Lucinisca nassula)]|nr:hypothetical protein [Candidatus Thiodiazotropha sp. (ex. Lucinisca nassula)]